MSAGVLMFIGAILIVVMIHESGHFLMAKKFDFKATKFFLGFGPTLWSTTKGETEYGIKAFPLGGFVKIIGMNPYEPVPEEDRARAYSNKPRWQRALVLVAGSGTHFIVAFVILVITAMTIGFPTDEPTTEIAVVQSTVAGEAPPSVDAGFEPGDQIVAVDGEPTEEWPEVTAFIKDHPGEEVTFTVERDGESIELEAELGSAMFNENNEIVAYAPPGEELRAPREGETEGGFLGVAPEPAYETENLIEAIGTGAGTTWEITVASIKGIPTVFAPVFNGDLFEALGGEGEREADGALGLVGAGRIAGESVEKGRYLDFIGLIVYFTIFVGIMNLLPLPPLDGGHLAVLAYEGMTGREVDVRKLVPVAAAVISFFMLLFLAVLYLDLARPIEVPF